MAIRSRRTDVDRRVDLDFLDAPVLFREIRKELPDLGHRNDVVGNAGEMLEAAVLGQEATEPVGQGDAVAGDVEQGTEPGVGLFLQARVQPRHFTRQALECRLVSAPFPVGGVVGV
jgi:hypothetical protein